MTLSSWLRIFKPVVSRTIYRPGVVRKILWGPSRGLRYRIFPQFGLSHLYGGWEPRAQDLMTRHLRPGSVAYDLGANYGMHSLLMARLVGDSGHVYAFEPVPEILSCLKENVGLNKFSNVACVECAASDTVGEATFSLGHHRGAGHLSEVEHGATIRVKTTTLDDFVVRDNHQPPDFIKIDVEGAEGRALRGAETVLGRYRPILLIDLHTPEQDVEVGRVLLRQRYAAFRTENGERVDFLDRGWPHKGGLWGQVIAMADQ